MVGDEDRYSARVGDFADACPYLPALRIRSLGGSLAQEVCARRRDRRAICRRYRFRFPAPSRSRPFSGSSPGTAEEVWLGTPSRQNAPDRVRKMCRTEPETKKRGKPETFDFLGFTHISGKDRNGNFTVKRHTIGKRMRGKSAEIKQQLRQRMTTRWLKPGSDSSRSCKASSTITRYQATPVNL